MKKIANFFIILIIFELVYSGTEYIIVRYLGMQNFLKKFFIENLIKSICIYFCVCIMFFIFNYIYNMFMVKKLNSKLSVLKNERGK